jgi:protoheme IX farnesyltransferase
LNQVVERETDALMERTRSRPLPAGRIETTPALLFGVSIALLGTLELLIGVNALTAALGALTLALYVLVYTPMKRMSSLSTIVGAIPGALPPVMGWTAAHDGLSAEAWVLFGILFFWQMPHFLAIAIAYRDDYARGGHLVLPVIDSDGGSTGRQIVLYLGALLPVSLLPTIVHMAGESYFWGALVLGAGFLAVGIRAANGAHAGDRAPAAPLLRPLSSGPARLDDARQGDLLTHAATDDRPADAVLAVDDLAFSYGETRALDGISFTVARGEIFGLLGPNGGGKTTLFRILSTLLAPARGRASIAGHDVARDPQAVRRQLGVVFQAPSLDGKLTVRENMRHQGHLYGMSGEALERRIDEMLDRVAHAAARDGARRDPLGRPAQTRRSRQGS